MQSDQDFGGFGVVAEERRRILRRKGRTVQLLHVLRVELEVVQRAVLLEVRLRTRLRDHLSSKVRYRTFP